MRTRLEGADLDDVCLKLGVHLFRDAPCAQEFYNRPELDLRLRELASVAIAAPKLVQQEGLLFAVWNLGSPEALELAVFLEMLKRYSWLEIGTVESCLTELELNLDYVDNGLRLFSEKRQAGSELPR